LVRADTTAIIDPNKPGQTPEVRGSKPSEVRKVKVAVKRRKVTANWTPVAGAKNYRITLRARYAARPKSSVKAATVRGRSKRVFVLKRPPRTVAVCVVARNEYGASGKKCTTWRR
jgi:hypothetical protein